MALYPSEFLYPSDNLYPQSDRPPKAVSPLADLRARTAEILEDLPPYYFEDPTTQQIINSFAGEIDHMEEIIEVVEAGRFPQSATDQYGMLALWERLLGLPEKPNYLSVEQRQDRAVARWRARNGGRGGDWVKAVTEAIGTGSWEYDENYPGPYQVTVWVPFPIGSPQFDAAESAIRPLTPAHLEIIIDNKDYFVVGVSEVDVDKV